MKKKFTLLLALVVLLGVIVVRTALQKKSFNGFKTVEYRLNGKTYTLLVADTETKWAKGLMNVEKKPPGIDGMIFVFREKKVLTFWNMNTDLDLNLVWLGSGKIVGTSFLPSIHRSKDIITVKSPAPADTAIEFFTN